MALHFVLTSLCALCAAGPSSRDDDQGATMLIKSLASSNEKPHLIKDRNGIGRQAIIPRDFSWEEQRRVDKIIDDLLESDDSKFWAMVDHLDDDSYCLTTEFMGETKRVDNWTVGGICTLIVRQLLRQPYSSHFNPGALSGPTEFHLKAPHNERGKKLKQWLQMNDPKPLYELQAQMCQWAIENVEKRQREDEVMVIPALRRQIQDLERSHKSLKVSRDDIDRLDRKRWSIIVANAASETRGEQQPEE